MCIVIGFVHKIFQLLSSISKFFFELFLFTFLFLGVFEKISMLYLLVFDQSYMFARSLFARICSTCKDLNSMNSYYLWFDFLSVVEDMINLQVPCTNYYYVLDISCMFVCLLFAIRNQGTIDNNNIELMQCGNELSLRMSYERHSVCGS
jgi:hypothetical protein